MDLDIRWCLVNEEVQRRHPPILPSKLTTNQNARFLPLADRHLLPSAQGQLAQRLQIILLITFIPLSTHGLTTLRDCLHALTPCPSIQTTSHETKLCKLATRQGIRGRMKSEQSAHARPRGP